MALKPLEPQPLPGAQVAQKRTLNGASTTHFKRQGAVQGFTLIEVLVALFILSISVLAGLRAAAGMTQNAERQWQMLLAQTCVDNALAQLRLSPQFANLGEQDLPCPQASLALRLRLTVVATPNPSFRRVDVQVMDKQTPLLRVTALQGRY